LCRFTHNERIIFWKGFSGGKNAVAEKRVERHL
jgi:hypothetical protein